MGIATFIKRNHVFLFLNILLVPILASLTYQSILSPELLAASVVLVNILPKIEDIKRRWKTAKHRDRVKKRTAEFNQELKSFEDWFQDDFITTEDYGTENLVNYTESVVDTNEKIYLPLLYIYLIEKSDFELDNHEITTLQSKLQTCLNRFSLVHPTEDDIRLAWGAFQLLCNRDLPYNLNPPDEDFLETDCFQEKFVHGYIHKEQVISKLTAQHEELSEYRNTLSQLYDSGKLSKFGIQQALIELDEELSYVLTDQTHYFVLMNELQQDTEIKEDITESVESEGNDVYTGSLNLSGGMYSLLLCVCDESWETNEFYERFLKDSYDRYSVDGFLTVHRAKFEGESVFRKRYENTDPSSNVLRGIRSKNLLTTGEKAATVNLREKLVESYLSTDELLSVLPLNLFLADLPSEKKEILVENNEDIKQKFDIDQLTDWAHPSYSTEEIALYLQQEYFPDDSEKDWVKNTEKIIAEAKNVNEALS